MFADDTLIYRTVNTKDDQQKLQDDLNSIKKWSDVWQMTFNLKKCYSLRISHRNDATIPNYNIAGHTLESVNHSPYLGVEFQSSMKFDLHINKKVNKANQVLGFLRRNLRMCPKKIKESAYQTLVRPHLEYASSAWDPYTDKNIKMIERIQKKAARFVTGNYTYTKGTMAAIMEDLKWMSLEKRRKIHRLTLLHKAIHKQNNLIIPEYVKRKTQYKAWSLHGVTCFK